MASMVAATNIHPGAIGFCLDFSHIFHYERTSEIIVAKNTKCRATWLHVFMCINNNTKYIYSNWTCVLYVYITDSNTYDECCERWYIYGVPVRTCMRWNEISDVSDFGSVGLFCSWFVCLERLWHICERYVRVCIYVYLYLYRAHSKQQHTHTQTHARSTSIGCLIRSGYIISQAIAYPNKLKYDGNWNVTAYHFRFLISLTAAPFSFASLSFMSYSIPFVVLMHLWLFCAPLAKANATLYWWYQPKCLRISFPLPYFRWYLLLSAISLDPHYRFSARKFY